jgi:hypothetical protein
MPPRGRRAGGVAAVSASTQRLVSGMMRSSGLTESQQRRLMSDLKGKSFEPSPSFIISVPSTPRPKVTTARQMANVHCSFIKSCSTTCLVCPIRWFQPQFWVKGRSAGAITRQTNFAHKLVETLLRHTAVTPPPATTPAGNRGLADTYNPTSSQTKTTGKQQPVVLSRKAQTRRWAAGATGRKTERDIKSDPRFTRPQFAQAAKPIGPSRDSVREYAADCAAYGPVFAQKKQVGTNFARCAVRPSIAPLWPCERRKPPEERI